MPVNEIGAFVRPMPNLSEIKLSEMRRPEVKGQRINHSVVAQCDTYE